MALLGLAACLEQEPAALLGFVDELLQQARGRDILVLVGELVRFAHVSDLSSGPHFRDYHLLLDEQAAQLLASIDVLAERARKVGGTTLRSIGHIAKLQRVEDNDDNYVSAIDMLCELMRTSRSACRDAGARRAIPAFLPWSQGTSCNL
jgi:hypothetical protein